MIDNKNKFIFVKIQKTAGTSVVKTLQEMNDEADTFKKIGHYHILDMVNEYNKDFFKFCFVRNPWDRCVSWYHYLKAKGRGRYHHRSRRYKNSEFRDFVINEDNKFYYHMPWAKQSPHLHRMLKVKSPFDEQIDWISKDGEIVVDFVGRFENIEKDFDYVCEKIGHPKPNLKHVRSSKHGHYTEYYDDETADIIAERFKRDIETFGYQFGD
jgi:hypothetical protein